MAESESRIQSDFVVVVGFEISIREPPEDDDHDRDDDYDDYAGRDQLHEYVLREAWPKRKAGQKP